MFPGRFLLGVGTGQAMSEYRFFGRWPPWKERGERLSEGLALMRKFWAAEDYFDWDGKYFPAKKLYLYTRPAGKIEIYVSARGKRAARIAGTYGDHLVTTVSNPKIVRDEIIPEFEATMRKRGRDPSQAFRVACVIFGIGDVDSLIKLMKNGAAAQGLLDAARNEMDPRKIQELGAQAPTPELIRHHHLVESAEELIPITQEMINAGCNYIIFSDESRRPNENMKTIKEEVIPHLRDRER
jgi:coenzyme F420-dependent glucose-6-phosphate dehydrogenase